MPAQAEKVTHLALVRPKLGETNFKGVAMPYKPPIDKIFALVLLSAKNTSPLESIEYWVQNVCPPEQFASWRDAGIHPIDIGDRKYHLAGVGSAAEFVAKEFGLDLGKGLTKVVEMANKNNKTGYLKGLKFPLAHMLREMYELDESETAHIEIITNAADVINSFVRVEDGQVIQPVDGLEDALPDLVEEFAPCRYEPMTLGRYMRDLWILGEQPADIRRKIAFWTEGFARVKEELHKGEASLEKFFPKEFDIAGKKAVIIRTDNRFFAKAAIKSRKWGIRVVVASDGHTVISTNGLDLARVAQKLQRDEPGKWYYQERMGALINGGPQYVGVEPTSISADGLIKIMEIRMQPDVVPTAQPVKEERPQPAEGERKPRHTRGRRRHGNRHKGEQAQVAQAHGETPAEVALTPQPVPEPTPEVKPE